MNTAGTLHVPVKHRLNRNVSHENKMQTSSHIINKNKHPVFV